MTNQVIKLKGFGLKEHIDLSGDHHRVLYYCKWDYGEIIEIHNPETFKKEYGETGLFDKNDQHIFESNNYFKNQLPFWEYFQESSIYDNDEYIDVMFALDNMAIMRIK